MANARANDGTDGRIAWETWNEWMVSTGSKAHFVREDEEGRDTDLTICGVRIPESGNGIEVGAGIDYGDGDCKRCTKIHNRTREATQ